LSQDVPITVGTNAVIWLGRVLTGDPRGVDRHQASAMGAVAGCFPGRWMDRVVTGSAVFGVSLPSYWLGIVLVIVFAVEFAILPATGMGLRGSSEFSVLRWSDARLLILPVVTLSMIPIGILSRTTRAAVAPPLGFGSSPLSNY